MYQNTVFYTVNFRGSSQYRGIWSWKWKLSFLHQVTVLIKDCKFTENPLTPSAIYACHTVWCLVHWMMGVAKWPFITQPSFGFWSAAHHTRHVILAPKSLKFMMKGINKHLERLWLKNCVMLRVPLFWGCDAVLVHSIPNVLKVHNILASRL